MKRRLFTAASAVSLLLAAVVVISWGRSYWLTDRAEFSGWHRWVITSTRGYLLINRSCMATAQWTGPVPTSWKLLPVSNVWTCPKFSTTHYVGHLPTARWPIWFELAVVPTLWNNSSGTIEYDEWVLGISHALFLCGFAACPIFWLLVKLARSHRTKMNHCPACGYDLRASKDACPECGAKMAAGEAKGR